MCTWQWVKETSLVVTAWATFVVCVAALLPQFLKWWRRPKLLIDYHEKLPYRRRELEGPEGTPRVWVRMRVENYGKSTLKGCIAKVTEIEDDKGIRQDFDPTILRWVRVLKKDISGHAIPCGTIDLKNKEDDYLNILWVDKDKPDEKSMHIYVIEPPKGHPYEFRRSGNYYLKITFYAENIKNPVRKRFYFQGHPEYDKFKFRLA